MIDDLDRALANIADQAQLRKGIVRVAAPQLMACTLLPQVIAAWRQRYPDIGINLSDSPVEAVTTRVLSGETDFGIGPERDAAPQLEARELMEMPFEAVVPPDHPLAARDRLTWSDLAAYPLITLRGQFTERLLADMSDSQRDVTLKPAHEVTYMTTALAMVASGLGITVGMPYAAPLVRLHGLRMLPLDAPALTRRFFVYTREQRSLSPAAAAFIAFLFDYVHANGDPAAGAPAMRCGDASDAAERPR
jgi:DNA-binding transcriptional LysR family regulator